MTSVGEKLIRSVGFPDVETMTSLQIDGVEKLYLYKTYSVKKLNQIAKQNVNNYKECDDCRYCTETVDNHCPNCKNELKKTTR